MLGLCRWGGTEGRRDMGTGKMVADASFVSRQTPYCDNSVKRLPDLPFLVTM